MKEGTERLLILRATEQDTSRIEDTVVREFPLTIFLNNQELVTLLCSPTNLEYLAVGFLFSEGLVKSKDEIKKITLDSTRGIARVETEGDNESAGELKFK